MAENYYASEKELIRDFARGVDPSEIEKRINFFSEGHPDMKNEFYLKSLAHASRVSNKSRDGVLDDKGKLHRPFKNVPRIYTKFEDLLSEDEKSQLDYNLSNYVGQTKKIAIAGRVSKEFVDSVVTYFKDRGIKADVYGISEMDAVYGNEVFGKKHIMKSLQESVECDNTGKIDLENIMKVKGIGYNLPKEAFDVTIAVTDKTIKDNRYDPIENNRMQVLNITKHRGGIIILKDLKVPEYNQFFIIGEKS